MFGKKTQSSEDLEYFVVYDSKVGRYRNPVLATNRFEIIRETERMMRDPEMRKNELVTNAEDFQVFKIGSWSKTTGQITPCNHEHILNLHELKTIAMRQQDVDNQRAQMKAPTALQN